MPDTLIQKESYERFAREAGQAVVTAGQRLKTGVSSNRDEMLILMGTLLFVVAMGMIGALLISLG
jgi:hypothetical protein